MKKINWQIFLGIALIIFSAAVYIIHYLLFRDVHHIFIYLIGDIAFVFIEVLLVTVVIHRLLTEREKRAMLEKMNMVIGAFYSEVGTTLLKSFARFDQNIDMIKTRLTAAKKLNDREFCQLSRTLQSHDPTLKTKAKDIKDLKTFLVGKRDFLIRLLENPILLEHASFTNLLWAVFHLADELGHRKDTQKLPDPDHEHINGDIKRVYLSLLNGWANYMKHLKDNYPYLFSLAIRTNPFDPQAKPEVEK
ncbi:MAG: hypothetical protein JSV53_08570 [candidate division WOR-3 bacterium]|nr:MAG: hypothetical protein JSV53_08570 [candidate division WOR-3 bacterium]